MKLITWLEKQVSRFSKFLSKAKLDVQQLDEKVQAEIKEYLDKQCLRMYITGVLVGIIIGFSLARLF